MKASKNCKLTPDRNVFHTVDILLATTLSPCSLEMSMDNLCCHPRSVVPFSLAPEKSQRSEKKAGQDRGRNVPVVILSKKEH